ncbi:MAG: sialate O-acetylesterase [Dysgonomonas sp.]
MKKIYLVTIFLQLVLLLNAQTADVILPRFFANGMVLQRETIAPFWGWSTPGSKVVITTSWNNATKEVTANAKGKWIADLATPQAGGPYTIQVNTKTISDVKIGEVWICSGQSNMKLRLGEADMWNVSGDNNSNIHFFEVPQVRNSAAQDSISGGEWKQGVIPDNMQHISAVGYYFARKLQTELNIPIGIIGVYEGGTAAEEWTSPSVFKSLSSSVQNAYGTPSGREAGCLYNAMVYPLLPYKVAGFIWYQGENNVGHQDTYSTLLKAMVKGWRTDFKNDYLPFYIVQLTSYSDTWTRFREIQQSISNELSNSGLAVTIDCGEESNIHPKAKFPVGNRLGDIALAKIYGLNKTYASPTYRSMVVEGNKIRVYFDHAENGLKISSGDAPQLFEIAGADGTYYNANAQIEGNTILLWSDNVAVPVAARYFWKNYAVPNTFSTDDYPLAPFRTNIQ